MDLGVLNFKHGRLKRLDYLIALIVVIAFIALISVLMTVFLFEKFPTYVAFFYMGEAFILFLLMCLIDTKRLRDIGWSGWCSTINIVFLQPIFAFLFFLFGMEMNFFDSIGFVITALQIIFIPLGIIFLIYRLILLLKPSKVKN